MPIEEPAPRQLIHIIKAYEEGNYPAALAEINSLQSKYQKSLTILNLRGSISVRDNDYSGAEKIYRCACELYPESSELRHNLATCFRKRKDYKSAIKEYQHAIRLKPNYTSAYKYLGMSFLGCGEKELALQSLNRAAKLANSSKFSSELGRTLLEGKFFVESISFLEDSIEKDETNTNALTDLGTAYFELGYIENARTTYKLAISQRSNNTVALNNLALLEAAEGKHQLAKKLLGRSIEINPEQYDAFLNLGSIHKTLGKLSVAVTCYQTAVKINRTRPEAYNNLANVYLILGYLTKAESCIKVAIGYDPESPEYLNNYAHIKKKCGKLTDADLIVQKAIKQDPLYVPALMNAASIKRLLALYEDAIALYKRVLRLDPENSEALHFHAACLNDTTKQAPINYVRSLFDKFAYDFEDSLVNDLNYSTPENLISLLKRNNYLLKFDRVLDLGCGTGLMGKLIKPYCNILSGVDLSENMLRIANTKGVYDVLECDSIENYLVNSSVGFNLYLAADVFVYIGDLRVVFTNLKKCSKNGFVFAFSTEEYEGSGYSLEKSGRYSHSEGYIRKLCSELSYDVVDCSRGILRSERGSDINGLHFLIKNS